MGTTVEVLEKLRELDGPTLLALVDAFPRGRSDIDAVLRGEKEITVKDVIRILFDRHGRAIPVKPAISAAVCDANRQYYLDVLPDGFAVDSAWLAAWQQLFNQSAGLDEPQFNERLAALRAKVSGDPTVANLLSGPCYPILLPKIKLGEGGYGAMLENFLLPAVERAYTTAFPDRQFVNCRKGQLADQVTIVDERHEKLVSDLAQGPIPGILCFPLQGFSVHAQRQFAKLLPDCMSLAGPIEIETAEALYSRQLSRDFNTPVKDCSAVHWLDPDCSLCSGAGGGELRFDGGGDLGCADDDYSGGVFVRG